MKKITIERSGMYMVATLRVTDGYVQGFGDDEAEARADLKLGVSKALTLVEKQLVELREATEALE